MQQVIKHKTFIIVFIMLVLFTGSIQAASNDIKDMNFKGADIRDVLRAVSEIAGINLVTDGSVKGNITIHLKSISFQKALDLITQSRGLAYKWDDNTVVVATPERIKDIYEEQDLKIKVLKNNDLERIKSIVAGIYPELNIQTDNKNEQIILVGSEDIIEKALKLIENIKSTGVKKEVESRQQTEMPVNEDTDSEIITKIITLNYSNPETISRNIREIYSELKLSANPENNQLIIHGEKDLVDKALAMITELDIKNEDDINIEERKDVKFATDEEEGKDSIEVKKFTEKVSIKNGNLESLKKEILNIEPELQITVDNINEQLIINSAVKENIANAIALAKKWDSKQEFSTKILRIDYVDRENIKSIVNNLYPDINFNINKDVREIILRGKNKEIKEVISLIEKLDVPRRQVIIEARVEEVSSSDLRDIGINPDNFSSIHFIKDKADPEDDGATDTDYFGQITGLELTWPQFLKAAEEKGTAETLANPHLMTLNGENANILIGERIPFKIPDSEGEIKVVYEKVGITLNFTPWITKNNEIELNVKPEVSSLGEERANGYNVIQTREVETNIRLQDGETFAIGGLIQKDTIESMQRVPVLSEIPILGELFKHRKTDVQKSELLIFITPRIVNDLSEKKINDGLKDRIENDSEADKRKTDEIKEEKKEEKEITAPVELKSGSDILVGNEVEKIINYSRRKREYNTEDGLPATLNIFYRIKEGEPVSSIAKNYGISVQSIKEINNIDNLSQGELITLPIPGNHLYRIQWGETLYKLAKRYDIELEELVDINGIASETNIPGGFIIIFPEAIK